MTNHEDPFGAIPTAASRGQEAPPIQEQIAAGAVSHPVTPIRTVNIERPKSVGEYLEAIRVYVASTTTLDQLALMEMVEAAIALNDGHAPLVARGNIAEDIHSDTIPQTHRVRPDSDGPSTIPVVEPKAELANTNIRPSTQQPEDPKQVVDPGKGLEEPKK